MPAVHALPAALAALLAAAPAFAQTTAPEPRRIHVVGHGEAEAAPDMAVARVGVRSRRATAQAAYAAAADGVAAVFDAVAGLGIEARDVRSETVSLNPVQRRDGDGALTIDGYEAAHRLAVRLRDLDALAPLLDAVATGPDAVIEGVAFALSDPQPAEDAARDAAVADAMRTARRLAEAAGVVLGAPVSISTTPEGGPRPMMRAMAMDAGPVAPGEQTVSVTVSMSFAIAD